MRTKKLVLTALFIALSFVGSNLKVMGTIAFDSMPGFLGALMLGPVYGAIIGGIGHFLTALTSGFPLSLPVHLITMIGMAVTMTAFTFVYKFVGRKNQLAGMVLSTIVGVIINGPLTLLVLTPLLLPVMGKAGILGLVPVLSLVAAINAIVALLVYKLLPRSMKEYENK
ncbi:ECF transporter S component [Clostridium sp. MSJ-11]|uniref:ECF transporter S component n=1 Tax=Clostridium mobile TaxID=2841512 RepID=A0ABS6EMJ3_9CLOT|nr:ECF transporter S component [Clostridium mobile]MBU5485604.1 ECF transporter S component [Clostridium mobile]